jgi:hypothetical protein
MTGDLNARRLSPLGREQRDCGIVIETYQLRRFHERA